MKNSLLPYTRLNNTLLYFHQFVLIKTANIQLLYNNTNLLLHKPTLIDETTNYHYPLTEVPLGIHPMEGGWTSY